MPFDFFLKRLVHCSAPVVPSQRRTEEKWFWRRSMFGFCDFSCQNPFVSAGGGAGENAVMDELNVWRREMQQRMRQDNEFIAELSARKHNPTTSDVDPEQYVLFCSFAALINVKWTRSSDCSFGFIPVSFDWFSNFRGTAYQVLNVPSRTPWSRSIDQFSVMVYPQDFIRKMEQPKLREFFTPLCLVSDWLLFCVATSARRTGRTCRRRSTSLTRSTTCATT